MLKRDKVFRDLYKKLLGDYANESRWRELLSKSPRRRRGWDLTAETIASTKAMMITITSPAITSCTNCRLFRGEVTEC